MNADGTERRAADEEQRPARAARRMSPDGSQVLFVSGANARFETYYNGRLFVVPAAGGAARVLVGENEAVRRRPRDLVGGRQVDLLPREPRRARRAVRRARRPAASRGS